MAGKHRGHSKMPNLVSTGEQIGRMFVIEKLMSSGTYGQVYRANYEDDEGMKRQVAIKIESLKGRKQILKIEGEIVKKMTGGPNVVRYVSSGVRDGDFNYLVLELSEGSLRDYCVAADRLNPLACCRIMIQGIEGLKFVHERGYLHRDVKPGNMVVQSFDAKYNPRVKFIDFGLSRRYLEPDGSLRPKRADGTVHFKGTKLFCTVNNLRKNEHTRQCDLMSLTYGLITHVANKRLPWSGNEAPDVLIEKRLKMDLANHINSTEDLYAPFNRMLNECSNADYTYQPRYVSYLIQGFKDVEAKFTFLEKQSTKKSSPNYQNNSASSKSKTGGWFPFLNKLNGLNMVNLNCGRN